MDIFNILLYIIQSLYTITWLSDEHVTIERDLLPNLLFQKISILHTSN